jgi:hypothetical protein
MNSTVIKLQSLVIWYHVVPVSDVSILSSSNLKVEAAVSSKVLVHVCQTIWYYIPKEHAVNTTVRSLYHNIPFYVICSYSSVRIVTGYGLDSWGLIPGGSNIFFLLHSIHITLGLTHPVSYPAITVCCFLRGKVSSKKLTIYLQLALRSRMLELVYFHSPCLHAMVLNQKWGQLYLYLIYYLFLCDVLSNLFQDIFSVIFERKTRR